MPGQLLQLLLEGAQVRKFPVDRSKPDIGNLVDAFKLAHDQLADDAALHFRAVPVAQLNLHLIHNPLDLLLRDRPLFARPKDALEQLVPVEPFSCTVFLDHHQLHHLHTLVRGEAFSAFQALPPSPGGEGIRGLALIQDPRVRMAAVRA